MNGWMVWLDEGTDGLEEQIKRAVERFEKKYGRPAELVLVRSGRLTDPALVVRGVRVCCQGNILPKDIWVR